MSSSTLLSTTCVVLALSAHRGSAGSQAPPQPRSPRFVERPGRLEFSGQMIVRRRQPDELARSGVDARRAAVVRARAEGRLAGQVLEYVPQTDEHIVALPAGETENGFAERLLSTGDYQYVEPNWICHPTNTVPDDPAYPGQWHHPHMRSPRAWDLETGEPGIIVAFVDSGIALDHPDLSAALVPGYNAADRIAQAQGGNVYDVDGHGTFVAGCGAAIGNNGTDVAGVGWGLSIMPIRYYNSPGGGLLGDLLHGARWAVDNGARCVNVSQTGVEFSSVQTTGAYIKGKGGLLLYAAGNDGRDLSFFDWPDVVVVGGTDQSDALLDNGTVVSAHGTALDVFAPGADILSTFVSSSGTGLGIGSGTSAAVAVASGLAGLLWSLQPAFTPAQVEDLLTAGCVDLGPPGEDDYWGWGRIDSYGSLLALGRTGVYGCGLNPAGSMSLVFGTPSLGSAMILGIDNPLGTQAAGSVPIVALSLAPDAAYPCGTALAGFGMSGAGELLISLAPADLLPGVLTGLPWSGPGQPAPVFLSVPFDPDLLGLSVFAQGLLLDPTPGASPRFGLTDAVELQLGL